MGKKNLNPADAYRKAQRKKEVKKNKADRSKARDLAIVKKNTWDLEDEIKRLEEENDSDEKIRLSELKAELERINKKKAEYVAEHPEARRLVYRPRPKDGEEVEEVKLPKRRLFDQNGLPRRPERSIYYDPVMNPFGVAPPGMPYAERPPLPGEVWSDEESDNEDDGKTSPASGPRDGEPPESERDYDVEGIPMPTGPPPGQVVSVSPNTISSHPISFQPTAQLPGLPVGPPPGFIQQPWQAGGLPMPPGPPPPPVGFSTHPGMPLVPPGAHMPPFPPGAYPPPPPPGFFPRNTQSSATMHDPLANIPHQTVRSQPLSTPLPPPHPTLPAKPVATKPVLATSETATVFAAPELRDFKKEATAFVPTALKRKKPAASASSAKVNAAPDTGEMDEDAPGPVRPDLLDALRGQFGPTSASSQQSTPPPKKAKVEEKSDYEKWMEDMGDALKPPNT